MSLLHKRLTEIQNNQAEVRAKDKKRQKFLNRLKCCILLNEEKRVLRERFGKGPYSFQQYLDVYYVPKCVRMFNGDNFLLNVVSKDYKFNGASSKLPFYKGVDK